MLLFNVHLSSQRASQPIEFPDRESVPARRLRPAAVPHVQPAAAADAGAGHGRRATRSAGTRAASSSTPTWSSVIRFLDIGTRVDSKNFSRLNLKEG